MDNFLFLPKALAAALSDIAFATCFGLVIVRLWLPRDSEQHLRSCLRARLELCTAAMLLALFAQTYLLTATMIGSSVFNEVCVQFAAVMFGTHAGLVLLCNCCITLAFLVWLMVSRWMRSFAGIWMLCSFLLALAAARAATGHPASGGNFSLSELVQFVHLISIATWAGGIIVAGFIVMPALVRAQQSEAIVVFLWKLSRTVAVALLLIVLSGLYNSYRGLDGSVAPLLRTQWGGVLDIKIFLVCIAVVMGASNRLMLHRNPDLSSPQISRLALVLRAEGVVMALILIASALLANSPPPDLL